MPKDDDPRCYFCSQELPGDDNYCYGCGHYICSCCDHRDPGAMGSHPVEDHEDDGSCEEDEEDWDD